VEITPLRAFEAGALDYSLMNYFAIRAMLAPKRGEKRSVFCDYLLTFAWIEASDETSVLVSVQT